MKRVKKILVPIMASSVVFMAGCGINIGDYDQYIQLGEYMGVEYTPLSTEVTQEELDVEINNLLAQFPETESITEGTVADGDTINLDYVGYCDGEAFEGGDTGGAGTELTIGSGQYIEGFEEQLIGHEVGEEGIEVNVTFPENYHSEELSGKDATFICTINSIIKVSYAEELTDDFVSANTSYATVDEYLTALETDYKTYKEEQAENQKKIDIVTAVMENSTYDGIPEDELEEMVEKTVAAAQDTAESYGMDYVTYLSYLQDEEGNPYTEETYREGAREYVTEILKEKITICAIAKKEGIKVTQKDVDQYIKQEALNNNQDVQALTDSFTNEEFAYAVLYDKVMALLEENAVMVEK